MTAFMKTLSGLAAGLGFLLAAPDLLLLLAASQISSLVVAREQAARDHALDMECL